MRTFKVTLLFLASMFLASLMGKDGIDAYPRVSQAPATIRIRTTIELHPDNRSFCTGYDGPQYRESCEELEGDKAARTRTIYWKDLPGGRYTAFLAVFRKGDKTPTIYRSLFCIQGSVEDPVAESCISSPD